MFFLTYIGIFKRALATYFVLHSACYGDIKVSSVFSLYFLFSFLCHVDIKVTSKYAKITLILYVMTMYISFSKLLRKVGSSRLHNSNRRVDVSPVSLMCMWGKWKFITMCNSLHIKQKLSYNYIPNCNGFQNYHNNKFKVTTRTS